MKPPKGEFKWNTRDKTVTIGDVKHVMVMLKSGELQYYSFNGDGRVKVMCAKLSAFNISTTAVKKPKAKPTKKKDDHNCFRVGGVD